VISHTKLTTLEKVLPVVVSSFQSSEQPSQISLIMTHSTQIRSMNCIYISQMTELFVLLHVKFQKYRIPYSFRKVIPRLCYHFRVLNILPDFNQTTILESEQASQISITDTTASAQVSYLISYTTEITKPCVLLYTKFQK
jgi:hypothetical protein